MGRGLFGVIRLLDTEVGHIQSHPEQWLVLPGCNFIYEMGATLIPKGGEGERTLQNKEACVKISLWPESSLVFSWTEIKSTRFCGWWSLCLFLFVCLLFVFKATFESNTVLFLSSTLLLSKQGPTQYTSLVRFKTELWTQGQDPSNGTNSFAVQVLAPILAPYPNTYVFTFISFIFFSSCHFYMDSFLLA